MGPEQAVDDAMQRICAGSVSTHALRGESDLQLRIIEQCYTQFQSTPSARRATKTGLIVFVADLISIHALREESDKFEGDDHGIDAKISIHALRGESNEYLGGGRYHVNIFQSTPSARRATSPAAVYGYALEISIHALREEGDAEIVPSADTETPISIHALREEGDPVP